MCEGGRGGDGGDVGVEMVVIADCFHFTIFISRAQSCERRRLFAVEAFCLSWFIGI